ncbi:GNAT family N-acetyltransferase [Specibacter cremeus]|uniref:GNAT family N-acetyltransferase n=1 Tax=Specibacter cremeus TaxID=1629051 RepID=UPI000F7797D7|nr:GNAT family N-acetyltransferase [Specibacter cremeus]
MSSLLDDGIAIRFTKPDDDEALAAAYRRNREHLRPWEPIRPDAFYTAAGQRPVLERFHAERTAGTGYYWVLTDAERVVGRISLTDVVRGVFLNGHLGYWIDKEWQGRGLATAAVNFVADHARGELSLHRLQAGVLPHNAASRAVLTKCGFARFGRTPEYLRINGRWQDHDLFARILFRDAGAAA